MAAAKADFASSRGARPVACALLVLLHLLPLSLVAWLATPADTARLALCLVAFIYLPGHFLVEVLRLGAMGVERFAMAATLGIASTLISYSAAAWIGFPSLFLAWPAVACGGIAYIRFRGMRAATPLRGRDLAGSALVLAIAIAAIAPMATMPLYTSDFVPRPDGEMRIVEGVDDAFLHAAVTNELSHSFPPMFPFLAGKPLRYHYGMDLLGAIFRRFGGAPTPDICFRLVPPLLMACAVASIFAFARSWLASTGFAALVAFLTFAGEDFAWIPGLLLGKGGVWAVDFFQVPTIFSLYYMNPVLPALAFLFAGLACLLGYFRHARKRWVVLAGVLFGIMTTFKAFALALVGAALAIASVMAWLRGNRRAAVAAGSAVVIAVAVAVAVVGPALGDAGFWRVSLNPFPHYLRDMIVALGLGESRPWSVVLADFARGSFSLPGLVVLLVLVIPLFAVGSSGARVLGWRRLLRALAPGRRGSFLRSFLGWFIVLGFVLTLLLKIVPADYPASYNNAVWFYALGKYAAWIFVAEALRRMLRGRRVATRAAVVAVVLIAATASSVQFVRGAPSWQPVGSLGHDVLDVVDSLRSHGSAGDVVLCADGRVGVALVTLTGLRVAHLELFSESFLRKGERESRAADFEEFWRAWRAGEVKGDLAAKYGIRFVVTPRAVADATPSPTGAERIHENPEFLVYRIIPERSQARPLDGATPF